MYNKYVRSIMDGVKYDADTGGGAGTGGEPSGTQTELSLDTVKSYLETNEDAKKYVRSLIDADVGSGIETFKKDTLPSLVEEEIKKRGQLQPWEIEIQKLKDQLADTEKRNVRTEIQKELSIQATELGISPEIAAKYCVGETAEESLANLKELSEYVDSLAEDRTQAKVDERFKANYGKPNAEPPGGVNPVTPQQTNNVMVSLSKKYNR